VDFIDEIEFLVFVGLKSLLKLCLLVVELFGDSLIVVKPKE
jgi:hypothetical protein